MNRILHIWRWFRCQRSHRDHNINHNESLSDTGRNGVVERLVADMAIVTGDSLLKKFSEGLRQKASAEKNGPFAQ